MSLINLARIHATLGTDKFRAERRATGDAVRFIGPDHKMTITCEISRYNQQQVMTVTVLTPTRFPTYRELRQIASAVFEHRHSYIVFPPLRPGSVFPISSVLIRGRWDKGEATIEPEKYL